MKTVKGIYYDLCESTYTDQQGGYKFYFSSQFYKDKFKENLQSYINQETLKVKIKHDLNVLLDDLLMLSYYKKIEKRGFRVEFNGSPINPNSLMMICKIVRV